MKQPVYLLLLLALFSIGCGVLMSDASWIGRVGITLLHKEYNFLKIWWQGAIGIFLVYMGIVLLHNKISNKLPGTKGRLLHMAILILVITGLYFTHDDFTHTFSHKLLGRKFHWGAYLFWTGWATACLYYILRRNTVVVTTIERDSTEPIRR